VIREIGRRLLPGFHEDNFDVNPGAQAKR